MCLLAPLLQAGALDDYLANPPKVENPPWARTTPPHESIPIHLKQFATGPTDHERAVAIGCLAFTAQQMAKVPVTKESANEVLTKWVMPNVKFTKSLPPTSAYSWQDTVLAARNAYKSLGNQAASRSCLALLRDDAEKQTDREMAAYLMAYDLAQSQQYQEAIETFNTLPKDSKWADQRVRITEIWKKKQAEKEKTKQQAQDPQSTKP